MPEHVTGSIQALVISIGGRDLGASYVNELRKVRKRGVIRIVDMILVEKAQDGTIDTVVRLPWASATDTDGYDVAGRSNGVCFEGLADLAASVPGGAAAVVLIIEHHWAQRLSDAVSRSGGRLLETAVLGTTLVGTIERDLDTRLSAEEAQESAEAGQFSAALEITQVLAADGLISGADLAQAVDVVAAGLTRQASAQSVAVALAEAGLITRYHFAEVTSASAAAIAAGSAAAEETSAAIEAMDDLRAAVAIETMRAMYAARIIDDTATVEAVDVLVGAGIVEAGAASSAIEAVRSIGAGNNVDRRHDQTGEVADIGGFGDGSTDDGLL